MGRLSRHLDQDPVQSTERAQSLGQPTLRPILAKRLLDLGANRLEGLPPGGHDRFHPYEMKAVTRTDGAVPPPCPEPDQGLRKIRPKTLPNANRIGIGQPGSKGKGIAPFDGVAEFCASTLDRSCKCRGIGFEPIAMQGRAEKDLREADALGAEPSLPLGRVESTQLRLGGRRLVAGMAREKFHFLDQGAPHHWIFSIKPKFKSPLGCLRRGQGSNLPLDREKFHFFKQTKPHGGVQMMQPESPGFAIEQLFLDMVGDDPLESARHEWQPALPLPLIGQPLDIRRAQDQWFGHQGGHGFARRP